MTTPSEPQSRFSIGSSRNMWDIVRAILEKPVRPLCYLGGLLPLPMGFHRGPPRVRQLHAPLS